MRILLAIIILVILGTLAVFGLSRGATEALHPGVWQGRLDTGAAQLRLELHVAAGEDGELAITLVSLDQAGAAIPASQTPSADNLVTLVMPAIGASYQAEWLETGGLSGTFEQGGASFPLDFAPGAFPPAPAIAANPNDEALTVMSGRVSLAGSLRRPPGPGPAPAVLILSGSGPQDRDFTFGDQRIFANLASALADIGVASLRLDDRGVGESDPAAPLSPADLADDATAALAALRAQPGIDAGCVGILGHSEGGMIAFLAAPDALPSFILTLSGMNASLADTLVEQGEVMVRAGGGSEDDVAAQLALQSALFEAMRSASIDDARARIQTAMTDLGLPEAVAAQQAAIWSQPYALAELDLDPSADIQAYPGPVTAIFAALDVQVPAGPASDRLRRQRGDQPLTVITIPGVNHLYQEAETGLPAEYAGAGAAPAPEALTTISQAVSALTGAACPGQ
jgi:pimeloyl-ACP methyl ester carboxylesterase